MQYTLFTDRLKKDWRYQKGILSSVIDWTIVLYLIIPAIFFSGLYYRSLWIDPPVWFTLINWTGCGLLFFFLSLSSKWRTYLYEADTVYLAKRPEWIRKLLQSGFFYNLCTSFFFSLVVSLLFLPFTIGILTLSLLQIVLLLLMLTIIRTTCKLFLSWIDFYAAGSRNTLMTAGFLLAAAFGIALVLTGITMFPVLMILFIPLGFWWLKRLFNRTMADPKWLPNHGLQEAKWKVRWIRLVFTLSKEVETPPHTKSRKRPLLFRKSTRILKPITPVTGMLELFLKHHLRNRKFIYYYVRILGLIVLSAFLIPMGWLFAAAAALLAAGCVTIHKLMWETLIDKHSIGVKYRYDKSYEQAKNWTAVAMLTPIMVIAMVTLLT
ncbi:ABC transporter permease [Jeotgalibacillus campisalis]|uniref:Uncharacterized protein n=1 Tax=Jeotgalibacillus campisalis TaxID=220754 RepID=A0A0C2VPM5_9BACL|nr:ABC transporter permease [Jeotgalibacillus campisalis]KIL46391.1 hypothetical protein KR50_30660 [Jeotgalibacillus campisalis]